MTNWLTLQERERLSSPQSPFTYRVGGSSFTVGPIKVTAGKTKSHPALSPSRPVAASAAALVRDAVARLPRGEGARQEVEDLVRQSQFLSPAEVAREGNSIWSWGKFL